MRIVHPLGAAALALCLLCAPAQAKGKKGKPGPNCHSEFKGQIIFDTKAFPRKFKTGKKCVKYMKPRAANTKFHRSPSLDWNLHVFIFFEEAIGGDEFSIHYYKLEGDKQTFVTEDNHNINPELNTFFAQITLSEDEFEVGPTYEARAVRNIGGDDKIYARKKFSLLEAKKKGKRKKK